MGYFDNLSSYIYVQVRMIFVLFSSVFVHYLCIIMYYKSITGMITIDGKTYIWVHHRYQRLYMYLDFGDKMNMILNLNTKLNLIWPTYFCLFIFVSWKICIMLLGVNLWYWRSYVRALWSCGVFLFGYAGDLTICLCTKSIPVWLPGVLPFWSHVPYSLVTWGIALRLHETFWDL